MIDWTLVAIAGGAALVLLFAAAGLAALRYLHCGLEAARAEARLAAQRHGEVGSALADLAAATEQLRRRIDEVATAIERSGRLAAAAPASANGRAYELAARLAANGARPGELVASCGLTPAEAELAVRVHGVRVAGAR